MIDDPAVRREDLLRELHALRTRVTELLGRNPGDRRAMEEALRESRREWQTLVSNLPGFVYRRRNDPDWTMEMLSDGCEALTGYPPADLLHNHHHAYLDLIHSDDRERVREAVQGALDQGAPYRLQYRITARDGTEKWLWEQGRGVYSAAGEVVALEGYITDITPVRQAEQTATQLGHIIEDSLNEIFVFDAQTLRFLRVNRGARENLGYSTEELLGLTPLHLKPDFTPETFAALIEPLRTGELQKIRFTTVHRRKDGSRYPVEVHLQLSLLGSAPAFVAIITDIRERKRAERELQRVNRALQTVNECTRALVHAVDEADFLQEVCRIMVDTGGYRLAWIGFAADDAEQSVRPVARAGHDAGYVDGVAITWADTERGRGPTGSAIRTGRPCVVQDMAQEPAFQPWRAEAARRGFASVIALPLRGAEDRPLGALNIYAGEPHAFDADEVALLTGLTDDLAYGILTLRVQRARRQAEEMLRKLSTAVEQSPVSVIITDARGAIEYANPKFTGVTGYRLEEVLGRNPRILQSGEMSPETYRRLWETIAAGHDWQGEFHNRKKSGELFWEHASISPIRDEMGAITHFVAVKEDITARKRMEEETRALEAQLRQAQKMETIGTLAGGIAHDFNNLLQAIIGYGGMVLEDTPQDSRPNRYVRHIMKAAESARDLVRQILTFSRQVNVERRPVRIARVVREATALLRATLPASITLRQSIDPECRPVLANISQIHQVVMNLCTNASHAMLAGGGVLEVRLENVAVTRDLAAAHPRLIPGEYVRLRVSDTGVGIDPRDLERIFDPFFTTKGPQEGTGLGLSVVHGIVTSQGGEIVVHSERGRGTTCDIYLPPAEKAAEAGETAAPRDATGDERILYVEDDAEVAGLVREMLERLGYRVTLSGDGAEAREAILAAPADFDLVITDQMMPHLTGLGLAEEVRAVLPDLPIVLVTGFGDGVPAEEMERLGIRAIVHKPVLAGELSRAIRRVMDNPVRPRR